MFRELNCSQMLSYTNCRPVNYKSMRRGSTASYQFQDTLWVVGLSASFQSHLSSIDTVEHRNAVVVRWSANVWQTSKELPFLSSNKPPRFSHMSPGIVTKFFFPPNSVSTLVVWISGWPIHRLLYRELQDSWSHKLQSLWQVCSELQTLVSAKLYPCSQLAGFEHVAEETLYGYASDGLTEKQFFYSLWVDHSQGRKHKKQFSKANLLTGKVPPDIITQHYLCLVLVAFHLLRIS